MNQLSVGGIRNLAAVPVSVSGSLLPAMTGSRKAGTSSAEITERIASARHSFTTNG